MFVAGVLAQDFYISTVQDCNFYVYMWDMYSTFMWQVDFINGLNCDAMYTWN